MANWIDSRHSLSPPDFCSLSPQSPPFDPQPRHHCRCGIVTSPVEIASILCNINQSNPRGAAHERSGNSFRGGVSPRFTRRLRGQSTVEYVLIIAIIGLVVVFAGPWVASAIRNQFNTVSETIASGTTGENFYDPVDLPDPSRGKAFAVYSEDDDSLMFYKRRGVPKVGDMFNDRRVTEVYTGFETTTPPSSGDTKYEAGAWHEYKSEIKTVTVVDSGIKPNNISGWFGNFTALESFDIGNLDMADCRTAEYLFAYCRNLTSADLSGWHTPALKDIGGMFEGCTGLKSVSLEKWNAPKVTACWFAFCSTSLESIDLSKTTFGKMTTANSMFANSRSLKSIDFGAGVDFSATANFSAMFRDCRRLQLDCSNWNVHANAAHNEFNDNAPNVILPKVWQ